MIVDYRSLCAGETGFAKKACRHDAFVLRLLVLLGVRVSRQLVGDGDGERDGAAVAGCTHGATQLAFVCCFKFVLFVVSKAVCCNILNRRCSVMSQAPLLPDMTVTSGPRSKDHSLSHTLCGGATLLSMKMRSL
jgi:hypothetical protein